MKMFVIDFGDKIKELAVNSVEFDKGSVQMTPPLSKVQCPRSNVLLLTFEFMDSSRPRQRLDLGLWTLDCQRAKRYLATKLYVSTPETFTGSPIKDVGENLARRAAATAAD
jgi:hypothetical protein